MSHAEVYYKYIYTKAICKAMSKRSDKLGRKIERQEEIEQKNMELT